MQHSEDLEESTGLSIVRIKSIRANIYDITIQELESILEFVIEDLPQIRTADKARSVLDNVDKMEFIHA